MNILCGTSLECTEIHFVRSGLWSTLDFRVECAAYLMGKGLQLLFEGLTLKLWVSVLLYLEAASKGICFLNDCRGVFSKTVFLSHTITKEFPTMQAICAWLYKDIEIKRKTDDLSLEPVTMLGLFLLNEQLCSTVRVGGQRALNITTYKFKKYLLSQNSQWIIYFPCPHWITNTYFIVDLQPASMAHSWLTFKAPCQ